jgi:hypothetical protein
MACGGLQSVMASSIYKNSIAEIRWMVGEKYIKICSFHPVRVWGIPPPHFSIVYIFRGSLSQA